MRLSNVLHIRLSYVLQTNSSIKETIFCKRDLYFHRCYEVYETLISFTYETLKCFTNKQPYKRDYILQKRPILSSMLWSVWDSHMFYMSRAYVWREISVTHVIESCQTHESCHTHELYHTHDCVTRMQEWCKTYGSHVWRVMYILHQNLCHIKHVRVSYEE